MAIKFLEEGEAEKAKQQLEESLELCDSKDKDYTSLEINWVDDKEADGSIKQKNIDLMSSADRLFFIAHSNDHIRGRPQLVENTKKRIVLIRKIFKVIRKKDGEDYMTQYKFIGDLYDKRYDGQEVGNLSLDFLIYKVIDSKNIEHFVLSHETLPNEVSDFYGMSIELDDSAEMTRTMRLKSLSRVFILKNYDPSVKILSKEGMIEIVRGRKITEQKWLDFLAEHPNGSLNRLSLECEKLRSAFVLGGRDEGYPLHIVIMGKAGTKKTMGCIETTAYKFSDEPSICEGANSRIKGLSPSFKEKPANIGFLAKAERIAFIDEIGKMVEQELNKHQQTTGNHLGELNFLMEQKKRTVNSGNDNDCTVQATAKIMKVTNPVNNKHTIHSHIGSIDPTYMSRSIWWVQDYEETEFLFSSDSIVKIPPTPTQDISSNINIKNISHEKSLGGLSMCGGEFRSREEFLTLFDTCYSFVSQIDSKKVQELVDLTIKEASEPMKSSVWRPRAFHHCKLLVDGLCKQRCLFKDYDSSFISKPEDYEEAKKILLRMVKGWNTDFSQNKRYSGGLG